MTKERLIGRILEANAPTLERVAQALDGMPPDGAQLLTIDEARRKLSVSRTTIWALEKRGALKPVILPVSGKRFTMSNIRALMRGEGV